ncbi:hypothetical protein LTR91_000264 [Friedmanniomyces endolithicus]|uniref:Rho-GAP domain-containing protein n=1 Tax=Friedmanniomyces endolithicus TaxID=329885 RepID=A0AAN6FHJ4_9PEZI|nr:hypothetical protein LTR82_011662 [Friedmanniomyces endolithicus]KAK0931315.1 hypothetical protein LTR57_000730 [Friedmanniomyces endolithicus]KAK1010891.1 hypothetical protein LTS01_001583 [Friedmanniomyces endolithicus]KAK1016244.1 hypothetical protein LTR91_000264 [Friedmanniomyces endolithicus]KAK1054639.1 hypothetical protein LTS16_000284 [Friedmanniomyces endolithicus]
MRTALAAAANRRATRNRARSKSLSTVPPADTSSDYLPELAVAAASILYRSPLPSREGLPVYIINAAAFPDAWEVDYDSLLSYVLARLPGEDELLSGTEYEVIFFAGGQPEGATAEKKQGAGMGWYLQAYHVLSRATRKKLRRLYIVHPRAWVRVLIGVFGTVVSPKFKRKIVHVSTLSQLALHIPIERLLIPPSTYLVDRKYSTEIDVPYASGRRAFGARHSLPKNIDTGKTRLPRVLRETTSFILLPQNIASEGLFRIPPHSTLAGVLKESYDRGQQYIIWKEKTATVVQPGIDLSLLNEVRLEDAYGVHLAASLIKLWYRELREPIIPDSSYAELREKYGSPDVSVTPEDLADLILVASPTSPLTPTSRQILTRHLLPLLSAVAAHEAQNKMNAENLAILFSMCLVCGSNQMEDAMMANVIKKILQAAISMWQELRRGLGIDPGAFEADLQPPRELRDYEDSVEDDGRQHMVSEDDSVETREGHRITMADLDGAPESRRAPTLPLRPLRARAASAAKQLLPSLEITSSVKRKPSPASASTEYGPATLDPPRYSTVFDGDGRSLHVADSPASYVPADGVRPARRDEPIRYGDEKKQGMPLYPEPTEPHPALNMPKRKALSTEQHDVPTTDVVPPAPTHTTARSASEGSSLARMAALKAASSLAQRMGSPSSSSKSSTDGSDANVEISGDHVLSEGNGGFRKPTWPASANRQPTAFPTPTSSTKPTPTPTLTVSAAAAGPSSSYVAALPTATPRPRAPSPGLLKRFETIEAATATTSRPALEEPSAAPRRMNFKKASVDDLRRLYEDRLSTAEALRSAEFARRGSAVGIGSQGSSFSSV